MKTLEDFTWPHCPNCNQRRQTRCPVCHVAGVSFPLGDFVVEAAPLLSPSTSGKGSEPSGTDWLICTCCDEPFQPRYYRYCHHCEHDFGSGIVVSLQASNFDELTGRALAVLAAIFVFAVLTVAYLTWVLA